MLEKTKLRLILYFTIAYLLLFTFIALLNKNYEFLFYTFTLSVLIFVIVLYHKKMHLTLWVISGLAVLALLHILGGNVHIMGTRLYDFWLIDNFFKYDNFVHLFGGFIAAFVAYSFLKPHLDGNFKHNKILLSVLLVLVALGLGAIIEMQELIAAVYFGAAEQVGGYINNILDLVFNMFGAICACFIIMRKFINK